VIGQEFGVIYPDTIFPDTTIEYRKYGDFDYYNKAGQRVGGGRQQKDGSYKVFYKGRVRAQGYLFGTEPKKEVVEAPETVTPSPVEEEPNFVSAREVNEMNSRRSGFGNSTGSFVARGSNGEAIRSGVDKTSYNMYGQPYYRWNSEEKNTSYIKDPRVRAEVRDAQNKEWTRQHKNR
jgi:hypothetical protein